MDPKGKPGKLTWEQKMMSYKYSTDPHEVAQYVHFRAQKTASKGKWDNKMKSEAKTAAKMKEMEKEWNSKRYDKCTEEERRARMQVDASRSREPMHLRVESALQQAVEQECDPLRKKALQDIQENGWTTFDGAIMVPEERLNRLREVIYESASDFGINLFLKRPNDVNDHRTAYKIDLRFDSVLLAELNSIVRLTRGPEYHVWNCYLLYSKPGCGEQAAHADVQPDASADFMVSYILTLENDAQWVSWDHSLVTRSIPINDDKGVTWHHIQERDVKRTVVRMNCGHLLMFHSAHVHAGASYPPKKYPNGHRRFFFQAKKMGASLRNNDAVSYYKVVSTAEQTS